MACPQVEVILADSTIPAALTNALRRNHAAAAFRPLSQVARLNRGTNVDALVVVLPEQPQLVSRQLRVLFDDLAHRPCPTLVLSPNARSLPLLSSGHRVPVAHVSAHDGPGLARSLETALAAGRTLRALRKQATEDRRAAARAAADRAAQLRRAGQVQRSLLPVALPRSGPVSLSCLFRPASEVCCDVYDVQKLDEQHIGIALADVGGNDVRAALLTMYVKRALRIGRTVGPEPPDPARLLQSLNADLFAAEWDDRPTVAAACLLMNTRTLEVALAQGGMPSPLYRTAGGELSMLQAPGSVLGLSSSATYELRRFTMRPGDSLLLYSDGLERVVCGYGPGMHIEQALKRTAARIVEWNVAAVGSVAPCAVGAAAAQRSPDAGAPALNVACPERTTPLPPVAVSDSDASAICASAWAGVLRARGVEAALKMLAERCHLLRRLGYPLDSLTVLAVQVQA